MINHAGLGYRRSLGQDLLRRDALHPSFVELAPENWMGIGGFWRNQLAQIAEMYPITAHGLSLSIGSSDPLDFQFLRALKSFLNEWKIDLYSEHLSFSQAGNAHVYELLPIPFTEKAIDHVVPRIKQVQDFLERPLVLEIVSYYATLPSTLREVDFINAVARDAGCSLLLDVNNVYVNGINHGYDPFDFISALDTSHVKYIHMAGHDPGEQNLLIDSHTEAVAAPVFELLGHALQKIQAPVPVLLERDGNFPSPEALQLELDQIDRMCNAAWPTP